MATDTRASFILGFNNDLGRVGRLNINRADTSKNNETDVRATMQAIIDSDALILNMGLLRSPKFAKIRTTARTRII